MRRTLVSLALAAAATAGCGAPLDEPGAAGPRELRLLIWAEYIDPEVVAEFERRTDCKVTVDTFEDNDDLLRRLRAGAVATHDVVVPSDFMVPTLLREGLLATLRHENLPSLGNLERRFTGLAFDPGNSHTVPYQWGTTGLYVLDDPAHPVEETWGLIFDPALQPGPFLLLDSMREMMLPALIHLGLDPNSTAPADVAAAEELLRRTAGRAAGWADGVTATDRVASGEMAVAVVYNGDAVKDIQENPGTRYFVPREGGEMWVDNLAIPRDAPHRELAERFLDFVLEGQIAGRIANSNRAATPNRLAKPWVRPEDLANRAIYPGAAELDRLHLLADLGDVEALYREAWARLRGARE